MNYLKSILSLTLSASLLLSCGQKETRTESEKFSFVFLTDIHMQNELGARVAFQKVIDTVNQIKPEFIMTGGDLIFDVLRGNPNRADSLFTMYKESIKQFNAPVHNTIGNHELFGIYPESGLDSLNVDFKYGLYKRHLGDTYYSFDHKGWHFISLNSIMEKNHVYYGMIDEVQMAWIKQDIANVDAKTPIALVTHIPFYSAFFQEYADYKNVDRPNGLWIYNREEVLQLFDKHNLKLVLQGHVHWLEDINKMGKTRFITGGAVAGRPSWKGAKYNEEGFLNIHIGNDDEITWDYIDYGWQTQADREELGAQ